MLILVRHGRTEYNAKRRLLGHLDLPLDDVGRRQAEALGDLPELHNAARVITSPLKRAVETASALGPPITVDESWIEIDYGVFDGLPLEDIAAALWTKWETDTAWAPEGGESVADVGRRIRDACEAIWDEAAVRDVVVVSHVSPIKAAVAWGMGSAVDAPGRLRLDVASICRVGPGVRGPVLHSFNEICSRPTA